MLSKLNLSRCRLESMYSVYEIRISPKNLENIYPLSLKEENSATVSGKKVIPIRKNTNHHLKILKKSASIILNLSDLP